MKQIHISNHFDDFKFFTDLQADLIRSLFLPPLAAIVFTPRVGELSALQFSFCSPVLSLLVLSSIHNSFVGTFFFFFFIKPAVHFAKIGLVRTRECNP